ncbi:antitoxin VbhA family protein [Advenella incenata]
MGEKQDNFCAKPFLPVLPQSDKKNPTYCNITLLKVRKATMADNGTHETGLSQTISDVERRRREVAVDYARSSVGLEGFSLGASDAAHILRFIDGEINLTEFVPPRDVLACPKT